MTVGKREQVALQCDAVVHMAKSVAEIHSFQAKLFRGGHVDDLIEQVGNRTSAIMENLGDMLNATDSCVEEDEWMDQVFEEAQRLWPQPARTE